MLKCWQCDKTKRPRFSEIESELKEKAPVYLILEKEEKEEEEANEKVDFVCIITEPEVESEIESEIEPEIETIVPTVRPLSKSLLKVEDRQTQIDKDNEIRREPDSGVASVSTSSQGKLNCSYFLDDVFPANPKNQKPKNTKIMSFLGVKILKNTILHWLL